MYITSYSQHNLTFVQSLVRSLSLGAHNLLGQTTQERKQDTHSFVCIYLLLYKYYRFFASFFLCNNFVGLRCTSNVIQMRIEKTTYIDTKPNKGE